MIFLLLLLSGILYSYCLFQISVWWLFHIMVLFWKVRFPFHARSFEVAHKIKYIHIICVLIGLLLPLVPIVISMAKFAMDINSNEFLRSKNITFASGGLGYGQIRFPPVLCYGTDRNSVFYSLILLVNIILATGITFLILLFWLIHKVSAWYTVCNYV